MYKYYHKFPFYITILCIFVPIIQVLIGYNLNRYILILSVGIFFLSFRIPKIRFNIFIIILIILGLLVRLFRFDNSIAVPRKWLTPHQIKRYKSSTLGILHEPEEEGHFLEALGSLSERGAYLNIGAAWGYYSLLAKKTRPDLDVFAVEAHPKMCSRIFEGSMINGVNGISVFNSAVVGKDGLNDGPMKIKFGYGASVKSANSWLK